VVVVAGAPKGAPKLGVEPKGAPKLGVEPKGAPKEEVVAKGSRPPVPNDVVVAVPQALHGDGGGGAMQVVHGDGAGRAKGTGRGTTTRGWPFTIPFRCG